MEGNLRAADGRLKEFKERYGDRKEDMADIVYHEGLHFVVVKKYDKAVKRFRYVLEKYDETEWVDDAAYQVALSHYYNNEKEKALALFRGFVEKYPQSEYVPAADFKIAMIYHENEDFARAAEVFAKVSRNERADRKTRFRAASNAAVDYQKIAGWDDAAAMYTTILKEFPDAASASLMHLRTGFALAQASRFEAALQHFEQASVDPAPENKPELLYWLATCHAKLGNYQRAITEYLKVPYLYSGVGKWGITSEFEAARLYERLGRYERAQSLYRKIVRSDGEQGDFGKNAAMRLERLDNLIAQRRHD
jgi:TolA-binding protein